ncbi:Cytochrome P450 monooxygenase mpaDE [Psilocybe cubensis]|uniref:Cytochrome P450 monooxygenase mpaDE n=2 Tax=Psilocybe cubensis TaxID=181762 RepID=A0ACB8GY51_PSICU|nr:Cytochrome P450 monooxygenase mpaDE [Psilocybe cubensis]KAH9480448.1 Cytochrome P450 monooxygenase mpaDE [Psilocybe cubensis]
MALPSEVVNQAFCVVSALDGGHITAPEDLFITNPVPDYSNRITLPSLCFLIQHSTNGHKFLFDLGIPPNLDSYPPAVQKMIANPSTSVDATHHCVDSLAKGNTRPEDIDYVCISHIHWDHTGDPSAFTKATFISNEAVRPFLAEGYPTKPDAAHFSDLYPMDRTRFLDFTECPTIGPFPRGHDFYGDGSLYIIDSPGHLPGHINVLARTSPDGAWIYLAGDSTHHWKIITGESSIKVGAPWDPTWCLHIDKNLAEKHIDHIRELLKISRVRVLIAHELDWYADNKGGSVFWPGSIPSL